MPWPDGLLPEFKPDLGADGQARDPGQVRCVSFFCCEFPARESKDLKGKTFFFHVVLVLGSTVDGKAGGGGARCCSP